MGDLLDDLDVQRTRPKVAQPATTDQAAVARSAEGPPPAHASLLELQRLAGNASVNGLIARSAADDRDDEGGARSPVLDVVGRGGGEPLDAGLRGEMEARLGADFGDVRVHRDATASDSARAVEANAYTVGRDVVFRSDRWDPSSSEGKRTLAHELTHVVQQSAGPVAGSPAAGGINVSSPSDEFEIAAERTADAAMAGAVPAASASDGPAPAGPSAQLIEDDAAQGDWVQRQDEEELEEEEEVAQGDWVQRQEEELEEEEEVAQGDWVQRQDEEELEEEEMPGA
jgi:hypothetical protein